MVHFQVEMQDLTRIESALGMAKDKSAYVLRAAINATARQTVPILVDEARRKYHIKKEQVKKTLEIKKATISALAATVTSTGKVNELYDFKVSPRRYIRGGGVLGGYKGSVRRDKKAADLVLRPGAAGDPYKAFIVRYRSGHITVGQRVPGRQMHSKPGKEFVKSLFSPSVPTMLGNEEGVYGVAEPQVQDLLQRNIQEQIRRFLG